MMIFYVLLHKLFFISAIVKQLLEEELVLTTVFCFCSIHRSRQRIHADYVGQSRVRPVTASLI